VLTRRGDRLHESADGGGALLGSQVFGIREQPFGSEVPREFPRLVEVRPEGRPIAGKLTAAAPVSNPPLCWRDEPDCRQCLTQHQRRVRSCQVNVDWNGWVPTKLLD
jgi:hypothetical protein